MSSPADDVALHDHSGSASDRDDARDQAPPDRAGIAGRVPAWAYYVVVAAIVTGSRWLVCQDRTIFSNSDEVRQLATARTLVSTDWLTAGLTYRPGYPILIAPIYWLTSDSELAYRLALFTGALLGGIAAMVLVKLATMITSVPLHWSCALAVVASVAPGVILQANWAASESLIVLVFAGTTLATVILVDRPSLATGAAAMVLSVFGYLVHGRLGPLVVSVASVVVFLAWRRRLAIWSAVLLLGSGAALALVADVVSGWARDAVWVSVNNNNSAGTLASKLADPPKIAVSILGMTWYQLVTTVGMAGLGIWAVTAAIVRPSHDQGIALSRRHAAVVATCLVPSALLAAVFMSTGTRAAQMVYGRYWDTLFGPVLLLGLCLLFFGARSAYRAGAAATLAALVVGGGLLAIVRQDDIDRSIEQYGIAAAGRRILGLLAYMSSEKSILVLAITAAAALLFLGVLLLGALRWRSQVQRRVALVVALLALTTTGTVRASDQIGLRGIAAASAEGVAQIIGEGDTALIRRSARAGGAAAAKRWMAYGFFLPKTEIDLEIAGKPSELLAYDYVFSVADDAELREAGATPVWSDPRQPRFVLWAIPPG